MYRNLEAELARKGISRSEVADVLEINLSTLSAKLNKPDRLKLCEAQKIQETFFPDLELSYLYKLS
ncbi:MAG: XRE family transcriptional regulator [Acutalibacteraceae bacterium]